MTLRRNAFALLVTLAAPAAAMGQQEPTERLLEALPPEVATRVVGIVADAGALGLPEQALANLALEGVAKGRSGAEVLTAVQAMVGDMGRAAEAIRAGGRPLADADVEAATTAMRMGVDAASIRELARTRAPGAGFAVPAMVLGSLMERGLPSDAALAQVNARLGAAGGMPEAGPMGGMPEGVGPGLGVGPGNGQVPGMGLTVPVGPPEGRGRRPGDLPGPAQRGRPQGPPGGAPIG
jgi:hypothetical protein